MHSPHLLVFLIEIFGAFFCLPDSQAQSLPLAQLNFKASSDSHSVGSHNTLIIVAGPVDV